MNEVASPWLRFNIGESDYAIPLHAVVEVMPGTAPRLIPLVPIALAGIVNVRGEPLPVVDGGALLGNPSPDPYRKVLVLQNETARIGVLVGHVASIEKDLSDRPVQGDCEENDLYVRWVIDGREKLGLIDPEALLERAKDLLTAQHPGIGEEPCPSAF
jgi:chemotaxis signal transduction protein